jgi:hypothetical protein
MKWDKPNGSTQATADGRYVVVHATESNWIAYELTPYGTGKDLGAKPSDEEARQLCQTYDTQLVAAHRRSA